MAANSSPTPPPSDTFRSYPQKYPKANKRADEAIQHIFHLTQKGPRSQVGTVVDASFHLSQGYVLCQIESNVVRVYSVPYGSVINQMRLFCRQIGATNLNRSYVFDGYAPNVSSLQSQTGSVIFTQTHGITSWVSATNAGSGGMPSSASLTSSTGYYWHCFFYVPQLPTATMTLWEMVYSTTNRLHLEYLPTGYLQFRSGDNHGYISSTTVEPHNIHWVQIQPGLTGNEMLIDGAVNYTGLIGGSDEPTFTGSGNTYTGYFLSNYDGSFSCVPGTWISKMGYGVSYTGGVPVALSASVPQADSDLPNLSAGGTRETYNLYLCTDTPGSTTIANSAAGGGTSATLTTANCGVIATGPY